jgi:hypothetical protein
MIKLKHLIPENEDPNKDPHISSIADDSQVNDLFAVDYSDAYNLKNNVFLFRALRKDCGYAFVVDRSKKERTSRGISNNFYTAVMDVLPSWNGYPKRSNSVIMLATSQYDDKRKYDIDITIGIYGGNIYRVYPKNSAKFVVTTVPDAFGAFKNIETRFGYNLSTWSGAFSHMIHNYLIPFNFKFEPKFTPENIVGVLNELQKRTTSKEEFINHLIKTNENAEIIVDMRIHFNGNWIEYLDGILNPEKNEIKLLTIDGLSSLGGNQVEVWTDAPCLLVNTKGYVGNGRFSEDYDISGKGFTRFENTIPRKIDGNFYCNENELTTLQGGPTFVKGHFDVSNNRLSSLENGPTTVNGNYNCSNNWLRTLKGAPEHINQNFDCSNNKFLTTLKDSPIDQVGGSFSCSNTRLKSLQGSPDSVNGGFDCESIGLTSLEGSPTVVGGNFWCGDNNLTSLQGSPRYVGGNFVCMDQISGREFTEKEVRAVCNVKGDIIV